MPRRGASAAPAAATQREALIAPLGHVADIAATDWLEPNVRNPDPVTAAAWIGETPKNRTPAKWLGALLDAICGSAGRSGSAGR